MGNRHCGLVCMRHLPQTSQALGQSWQQPLRTCFASTERWNLQRADESMCFNSRETSLEVEGTDEWECCPVPELVLSLPISPHSWEGDVFCHVVHAGQDVSVYTANECLLGHDLLEKLSRHRCVPFSVFP